MTTLGRVWTRYHPVVWWVLVIKALLGLSFTLLVPTYWGPDEPNHVDMIKWYKSHNGYPNPTEHTTMQRAVVVSELEVSPGIRPRPPQHTEDAVPRPDRVPFAELDDSTGRSRGNQMTQHPPLFYVTAAAGSSLTSLFPEGGWSWDREVYLYRLLSWLTFLPLPLLAAEAALAIGLSRRFTAVAASFTLLIPMTTFIGSVVSNDGLAVVFGSVAVVGALAYLNRGGMRWAAVAAVGCAGAPLTKSTVAPTAVWAVLVMIIAVIRKNGWRPSRDSLRHLAVVGGAALVGFSWHLTNVLRFGDPQPNGMNFQSIPGYEASLIDYLRVWIPRVSSSFWGQPARRVGVTLAPWMITALTVTTAALFLYAIARGRRNRWTTGLLALVVIAQVGLMFRSNWNAHLRDGRFPALQGRYIFVVIVPLAVLMTLGLATHLKRWQPTRTIAVAAAIASAGIGLHLFLAWSMFAKYWAEDGAGLIGRLRAVMAWSPLPVALTVSTFLATGLVIVLAAAWLALTLRAASGPPPGAIDITTAGAETAPTSSRDALAGAGSS